ncbi:MAG: Asp-tRNA(Asn)/Glu-tRNA(Gln) amidotransferase subunit GatB [bacterium]
MDYEAVIGLEVHAQLKTQSKIFCRCSASFGAAPNSQTCPVCLGLPGVLPVLNRRAVEFALRIALATQSRIAKTSVFARKNYFYPDLPKGYQISQYEQPLCEHGAIEIEINQQLKRIGVTRIHLEEDAGKSIHAEEFVDVGETFVDINRCGVPLVEIVSEPDIRSAREASLFLTRLRQIVQYLEICDGNMEEGSFRCDANVSVRPSGAENLGVKTELKNMNSFRGVEKALDFEIERQVQTLKEGGQITQQTLLWDVDKNEAIPMRGKESAHDYRYFPEPDLLPLTIKSEWIDEVRRALPELPTARRNRFVEQFEIPEYDANVLTDNKTVADYFEEVASMSDDAKSASNWVMGEVLRSAKDAQVDVSELKVQPTALAALIKLINQGTISGKIAKTVFAEMRKTGKQPDIIVKEKGLVQISDTREIQKAVVDVLQTNPTEVKKYFDGKEQILGFLVGQVMKATAGKANPGLVNEILRTELKKMRV